MSYKEVEEGELISLSQQGDSSAFDELVNRNRNKIYLSILAKKSDPEAAEEITQRALIKAWKGIARFQGKSTFYTWVYRISHNLMIDDYRKQKRRKEVSYEQRVDDLGNAGLKSMINNKVDEVIWTKVAFNSAMNSVCALLEATPKVIYQILKLISFALSVALETCSIAENAGYNVNKQEVIDNIELSCKEHGDHKPSMLQDILLKKKTEIDSINGEVARIGISYNVKTPLNNALFNMIKAKESEYLFKNKIRDMYFIS